MTTTQAIPCPNCGQAAIRIYGLDAHSGCHCPDNLLTRTECPVCDYVLSTCTLSGAVIEAYAPGIQLVSNLRRATRDAIPPAPVSLNTPSSFRAMRSSDGNALT